MDNFTFDHFNKRLDRIELRIKNMEDAMAQTLTDLQAAITAVAEAVAADAAQDQLVIAAIEALIAKINASPAAPDFTNEVAALGAAVSALVSSNTGITTELDKAATA